jgi:hypothetical protein
LLLCFQGVKSIRFQPEQAHLNWHPLHFPLQSLQSPTCRAAREPCEGAGRRNLQH